MYSVYSVYSVLLSIPCVPCIPCIPCITPYSRVLPVFPCITPYSPYSRVFPCIPCIPGTREALEPRGPLHHPARGGVVYWGGVPPTPVPSGYTVAG